MPIPQIGAVTAYLRAEGWQLTDHWRTAEIWSRDEFDVLVPPADGLPDTDSLLRALARCVADAEGRATRAVWRDLFRTRSDLVSYRTLDPDAVVPLDTVQRAVAAVHDLLAVCARDVATDADGEPAEALVRGSAVTLNEEPFGLDVAVPVDQGPDVLARRTILRLMRGSSTVLHAVLSDGPVGLPLDDIAEPLCLALSDLAGATRQSAFELRFRWSLAAPRPADHLIFPSGAGRRMRAAAAAPAADAVTTGSLEGLVTALADDDEGPRRRIQVRGQLEIDGTPVGRRRPVTVWLTEARDYAAALAAHRDGRPVHVRGTVTGVRTREITVGPQGLTPLDDPAR